MLLQGVKVIYRTKDLEEQQAMSSGHNALAHELFFLPCSDFWITKTAEDIEPLLGEVSSCGFLKELESLTRSLIQAFDDMRVDVPSTKDHNSWTIFIFTP